MPPLLPVCKEFYRRHSLESAWFVKGSSFRALHPDSRVLILRWTMPKSRNGARMRRAVAKQLAEQQHHKHNLEVKIYNAAGNVICTSTVHRDCKARLLYQMAEKTQGENLFEIGMFISTAQPQ